MQLAQAQCIGGKIHIEDITTGLLQQFFFSQSTNIRSFLFGDRENELLYETHVGTSNYMNIKNLFGIIKRNFVQNFLSP